MKITIIADSSCDLKNVNLTSDKIDFLTVPLILTLGEDEIVDEETLNTEEFMKKMKLSKVLSSACPSPEAFAEQMRGRDNIIVVTITSKLSGTYGAAKIAMDEILAENPKKKIYLFDTLNATAGTTSMLYKIQELIEVDKLSYDEVVERLPKIRETARVRFLLQDLSNLVKTGRMGKVAGAVVGLTPLKLICGDDGEGTIKKHTMAFGTRKGLVALAGLVKKEMDNEGFGPVVINHARNEEDALALKDILEGYGVKKIRIVPMRGLATFYANDKGIVIGY